VRQATIPAAFLIALAAIASTRRAGAQAPSADALFQEGLKLFDAGKTHEACERFEASLRLDPALGTLQNLATCHEADGKTARAYAEFLDLADAAAKAGVGQKAREILGRQRAATLAKKLSKIELVLGTGANVTEIRIDDVPLDRARWTAPVPVDPGAHTVVFAAPGKVAKAQSIDVSATPGVVPLEVPVLPNVPPPPPPPSKGMAPMRITGLAVGGVGALGIVLGSVFGGVTFAKKGAATPHCTGMYCDQEGLSLENAAHAYAAASTASFVIGLAAAGTGAFLYVWGGRTSSVALRVAPNVSARSGALRVDGSF
jgi:tetratricopeptide (TPR) repeat protein